CRHVTKKDVPWGTWGIPAMIGWLGELSKAGMKTAVLSNMHADMAEHARQNFKWLSGLTFVTLSAEVRLIKPAREIYELTLKGLKVASPEEALFIDDREVNVKGAREMGLHAVVFKSIEQLRQDLATAGFPYLPRLETSEVSARAN